MNNRIVSVNIKIKSIYLDLLVSDTHFKIGVPYFETKVQFKYANFLPFSKKMIAEWTPMTFHILMDF